MRNSLLTLLLVLLGYGASSVMAQAVCTPDPFALLAGIPGVYPNPLIQSSLTPGDQNVAYSQTITVVVPADTTIDLSPLIGFPFPAINVSVNYQSISAVNGLPNGLNFVCDPSNCQWAGGTNGCLKISGTPTQSGTFNVSLSTGYNVTIPGAVPVIGGTAQTIPIPGISWTLDITAVGVEDQQADAFWIADNAPNPFHGTTMIKYNAPKPATIALDVTDLTGKRLHTESMRAVTGLNEFSFDATGLAPGIYLYTLSNGEKSVTHKMVVQ